MTSKAATDFTVGSIRDFDIYSSRFPKASKISPEDVHDAYNHLFLMLRHVPNDVHVPRSLFQTLAKATASRDGMKKLKVADITKMQAWTSAVIGHGEDLYRYPVQALRTTLDTRTRAKKKAVPPQIADFLLEHAEQAGPRLPFHIYINAVQCAESETFGPAQALAVREIKEWADKAAALLLLSSLKIMMERDTKLAQKARALPLTPKMYKGLADETLSYTEVQELQKMLLATSKSKSKSTLTPTSSPNASGKPCETITYKCFQGLGGRTYIEVNGKRVYTQKS